MIRIQPQPFDIGAELLQLKSGNYSIGGTSLFVGSVRDKNDNMLVRSMFLEHYPMMAEKALCDIENQAKTRWPLQASLIVHRYGRLEPGDDIVLVITAAAHREDAFLSCQFLIDFLKLQAPFWKLEERETSNVWVEPHLKDRIA